jgi:fumarate hydratase, class I
MDFQYEELLQLGEDNTPYDLLTTEYVTQAEFLGTKVLKVDPKALTLLAHHALKEVSFKLRPGHLQQLAAILQDPEATDNDRFVAHNLLQNSAVAIGGKLPTCQDTGTAIIMAKKGQRVWTDACDSEYLSQGVFKTYAEENLRYSQMLPQDMFTEKNSGSNLPVQVDISSTEGDEYKFLFLAKGGGSANKTYLYQETKSLLNPKSLEKFVLEKIKSLGTSACPPYHLALVIGGSSAEMTLKLVKLASAGYLDHLPTTGNSAGRVFRDLEWEEKVRQLAWKMGIGAQFGGKYFVHDVRVIRAYRHAASCPVGLGVSCSADRNIKGKINSKGVWLERLESNPAKYLENIELKMTPAIPIDLDRPIDEVIAELSKYPVKTRLALSGTMVVARDIAHAQIKDILDKGGEMPEFFKNHPIYYAGPAKTPEGFATGSFGPTTAGRMDVYSREFMFHGGSRIMVAKGNRSDEVTRACKDFNGFYLGSIGGPAAILAQDNITSTEVIAFPELGMEAIRKITIKDFPAFIVVDNKGNNFFDMI